MSDQPQTSSQQSTATPQAGAPQKRAWTEEIEVAGDELVARIKHLAAEGQVRRIRLIEPDGDIVLDMPLTIGAIAGGAVVLAAPLLAVVGALAAFVGKVKLEIVRNGNGPQAPPETR